VSHPTPFPDRITLRRWGGSSAAHPYRITDSLPGPDDAVYVRVELVVNDPGAPREAVPTEAAGDVLGAIDRVVAFRNGLDDRFNGSLTFSRCLGLDLDCVLTLAEAALASPSPPPSKDAEMLGVAAEALKGCRDQFAFYATSHRAKHPPQVDKAVVNEKFATMCADVIAAIAEGEG
jgi:hypothetical protein